MERNLQKNKYSLWMLAWPIFIELFLQFLLGAADTLMVSRISDDAVAVVGFSVQIFNALTTLFITVSSGAGILIAQRIGAGKYKEARKIAIVALKVTALIGLVLSVALCWKPLALASLLQLPVELYPMAETYISIAGSGMILIAVMLALGTAIRNTGNTRGPMYIAIGMNVIHIVLNYGFIFGAFGLPEWGLQGVAVSTLVSRLMAVIVLFAIFIRAFDRKITIPDFKLFDRGLLKEVLHIGWPLGVIMSSWFFTQLLIYSYIAKLGAMELATRTYMNTLESFCFMLGFSMAMAGQIQIAHLFGAGRTREAYKTAYRVLFIGLGLVTTNALIVLALGKPLLGLFTSDEEIIAMGVSLLVVNLLLQPSKMLNMALNNALNALGDTRFVMYLALTSMWTIAAGVSYWVGIHLGWGLPGIYASMILDELVRGCFVLVRWKRQKYLRRAEQSAQPVSTGGGEVATV